MSLQTEFMRVAIVGTGMIGANWAAIFLSHGMDVVVADPADHAEEEVRNYVAAAWPSLSQMGLAPGASPERLSFKADCRKAVAGADLVLWCKKATPTVSLAE